MTASKLCRGCSGNRRRDSLTVHNTFAEKSHIERGGTRRAGTNSRSARCARRTTPAPRAQLLQHERRDIGEARRLGHHLVADAGERLDVGGNRALGVHQRTPFLDALAVLHAHDADLGDAIVGRIAAGRLQVDEYQILRKRASAGEASAASIERQKRIVKIGTSVAEHAPRLPVAAHLVQIERGGQHGLALAVRFGHFLAGVRGDER